MGFVNLIGNDTDDNIKAIIQCSESVLESCVLYADSLLQSNDNYNCINDAPNMDLQPTAFSLSSNNSFFNINTSSISICNQDSCDLNVYNYFIHPLSIEFCLQSPYFSSNDGQSSGSISFISCNKTISLVPVGMTISQDSESIAFTKDNFYMHSVDNSSYSCFDQTLSGFTVLTENSANKIAQYYQTKNCFCLLAHDSSASSYNCLVIDPNKIESEAYVSDDCRSFMILDSTNNSSNLYVKSGGSSTSVELDQNKTKLFIYTEVPINSTDYVHFGSTTTLSSSGVQIGEQYSNDSRFILSSGGNLHLAGYLCINNFIVDLRSTSCAVVDQFYTATEGYVLGHSLKDGIFNFIVCADRYCHSDGSYYWTCVNRYIRFCRGFIISCG